MIEKDLNIKYICDKTSLSENDELIPIILDMIKESYKSGLCQAEFDNTMNLIKETQQKEFIKYLEDEINICDGFLDTTKSDLQEIPYEVISANKTYITTRIKENETAQKVYEEILQKYKEIIGGKSE